MSAEPTAFLYPFIEADERDSTPLVAHLATSASEKISISRQLAIHTMTASGAAIAAAAAGVADRVAGGGRVFVFGNGGSSTDADALTADFAGSVPRVPAISLVADQAVLTALANDVGHDIVFSRQLIALGTAGDVAIGISTSGGSTNVLAAFAQARKRGMLTIATCGYGGGALAVSADVDHCLVVQSDSVHRIQEVQSVVLHELADRVRAHLEGVLS